MLTESLINFSNTPFAKRNLIFYIEIVIYQILPEKIASKFTQETTEFFTLF